MQLHLKSLHVEVAAYRFFVFGNAHTGSGRFSLSAEGDKKGCWFLPARYFLFNLSYRSSSSFNFCCFELAFFFCHMTCAHRRDVTPCDFSNASIVLAAAVVVHVVNADVYLTRGGISSGFKVQISEFD